MVCKLVLVSQFSGSRYQVVTHVDGDSSMGTLYIIASYFCLHRSYRDCYCNSFSMVVTLEVAWFSIVNW